MGNCYSQFKKRNRVSPDGTVSRKKTEKKPRGSAGCSGSAPRPNTEDMIRDLQIGQTPKIAAGGMTFVVDFNRKDANVGPKAGSTGTAVNSKPCPKALVAFTNEEKSLMKEISQLAKGNPKPSETQATKQSDTKTVTYNAEEKEIMAELLHADILRVISESSSSAKRQAKAADRRAEMKKARAASLADSATKTTSSAQERRERVKALAEKNRRQAKAAASQMPEVSN